MDRIPQLLEQDESMRLEVSTLAEGLGVPLSFGHAYLTVLVCVSGRARFALNFREVAVQRHDVLVLAEDTLTLLRQRSRGFLVVACLVPKALASEVAYVLPNALFKFLHEHPHCVPSPLEVPLLQGWLQQLMDAQHNGGRHRQVMLRNLLQTFFLKFATLLPAYYEAAPPRSMPGAVWRTSGKTSAAGCAASLADGGHRCAGHPSTAAANPAAAAPPAVTVHNEGARAGT